MKRLSITARITIWYAIILLTIIICFVGLLLLVGAHQNEISIHEELLDEVNSVPEYFTQINGEICLDKDFESYDDGVYISVYDSSCSFIQGKMPIAADSVPAFSEGEFSVVTDDSDIDWFIYDHKEIYAGEEFWVRGMMKDVQLKNAFTSMIHIFLYSLPALMILGLLFGYILTKRAFLPLRRMIDVVEEINEDGNLSRRVSLTEDKIATNNEIINLAVEFNNMFDNIEDIIEKEKQFTSDVSHELRTPVASIKSQSEYALEDESYSRTALENINSEAGRLSVMVNQLLTLYRGDSGKLPLVKQDVDLSNLCEMVAEQQQFMLKEENVQITADIEDNISVTGDEAAIVQVLINLIGNAVKYGRSDDGICNINIGLRKSDSNAICTVTDKGAGIEPEHLERIWDRFYRADPSRTDGSSGLGLSIVKTLVHAMDAEISAESKVSEGTSFHITFRIK